MEELTDRQVLLLYTRLEVPVAVASLLESPPSLPLSEEEIYAFEAGVSEKKAEETLLSLACAGEIIAGRADLDVAARAPLRFQSGAIITDYAGLYLSGHAGEIEGETVYMQEDFEALAELFGLSAEVAKRTSRRLSGLCSLLSDIADSYARALESAAEDYAISTLLREQEGTAPAISPHGNVVPFPGR